MPGTWTYLQKLKDWTDRVLTGASAPVVETRGYSSADDAIKTIAQATAVTFLWKNSGDTAVTSGTVVSWIPASTKRSRPLLFNIGIHARTTDALIAFQENTGTIGTPVWTSRMQFPVRTVTSSVFAIALPDQPIGPAGDGTGATCRIQIVSGTTPDVWATLHGYES